MHDGSIENLEEVVEHYMSGGKNHRNKNELIVPFSLTKREKRDLINFLHSLTDQEFIQNTDFANF